MSELPRAPTFPALPEEVRETSDIATQTLSSTSSYLAFANSQLPKVVAPSTKSVSSVTSATTVEPSKLAMNESSSSSIPAVPLPVAQSKSRIRNVLLWRDPKVTGFIFGAFMLFFYLTLFKKLSILSVLGAVLSMYLATGLIIVSANKMTGNRLDAYIARPATPSPLFRKEVVNNWAETIMEEGNELGNDIRDILYCDKTGLTIAWIFMGLFAYVAGKYFSLLPVFFVLTLTAFSLPCAYDKNKKEVDNVVAKATECASKHFEIGRKMAGEKAIQLRDLAAEKLDKAPPAIRTTAQKVGLTPAKKAT